MWNQQCLYPMEATGWERPHIQKSHGTVKVELAPPPLFDPMREQVLLARSGRVGSRETYLVAMNVEDDKQKRALLSYQAGQATQESTTNHRSAVSTHCYCWTWSGIPSQATSTFWPSVILAADVLKPPPLKSTSSKHLAEALIPFSPHVGHFKPFSSLERLCYSKNKTGETKKFFSFDKQSRNNLTNLSHV